ncbi:MAG: hypothetical protein A2289_11950 [Deltaproteobacteria bacterium RIFOXYA12_FULL_58_15]|nr:MAG: hypothetical protein A2289_11950 [Deltaproteobacteria bacterium RIFOXYA12_FULL_58_15]OGR07896.1 MAG: hypothetical protein A2341_19500 [Deltaproteobacteria bacterium RIFOXYB12_FULL_58_9]
MTPTFRSDLTCSREEQQGVVFYRIDDPKAQTSFRLYEIEYLIAKKLDGTRTLLEVIAAVKKEFNFDISEPDLQRFVNQLESMGFLLGGRDGEASVEQETAVMARPSKAPAAAPESLDLLDDAGGAEPHLDQAEFDRLLRSAFMHVKQGYIVHARDYFLAAKELNPTDDRLAKLVHHLEIIGDASGPAEVEYLWNQATELFPDVAARLGPFVDAHSGGTQVDSDEGETTGSGGEDIRSRLVWAVVALVVLAGGIAGLVFVFMEYGNHIFGTAERVRVAAVKAERIPIFHDGKATAVEPLNEKWLKIGGDGVVDKVHVAISNRVSAGDVLVSLELPDRATEQLAKAQKAVDKNTVVYNKAMEKLGKITDEMEGVQTERTVAEEKLKGLLRPQSVLKQGGVSKRDIEKWKTVKVEANKKLSKLTKKARGPKKQVANAEKKLVAAQKRFESLQQQLGDNFIRAPFDGRVVALNAAVGKTVKAGEQLVQLRDVDGVRLTFEVGTAAELQTGGEAHVALGRGAPNRAKVLEVGEGGRVVLKLEDPSGGFVDIAPEEFGLVKQFVEPAFRIPTGGLTGAEGAPYVIEALQNSAHWRNVEVLSRDASSVVIRDGTGTLRDGAAIVVGHLEGGNLANIPDGSSLVIEN